MAANDYHFVTHWRVDAPREQVSEILLDGLALPRWCPSVYLDAWELAPGDARTSIGREIGLYTKGWLPYTLRWQFRIVENRPPTGFTIEASGDFNGRGIWTLEPEGAHTHVIYDWRISADKPLLKYLSPIMRPLFGVNHEWAMARGEEGLVLELRRRFAGSLEARRATPPPRGPSFAWAIA
jgi:hypothetical protein